MAVSGLHATMAAVVGPEHPVSDPVPGPAAFDQTGTSAAWSGTIFLIVWSDGRSGSADIYGTRLSASGEVLDPNGIAISSASGGQLSPSVAWDGENFCVVWEDFRVGSDPQILGARVDASGTVIDPSGITISAAANAQRSPKVAWGGENVLVVWEDDRCGGSTCSDIYGTRLSPSGVVLDPQGVAISTADGEQSSPSLAWNGTDYLVVWGDGRCESANCIDVYATRVSPSGAVRDPQGIAVSSASNDQTRPSVGADGSGWLVAWEDERCGGAFCADVYGTRVSGSGTVLDGVDGVAISTAASAQVVPAVASGGDGFLVTWSDFRSGTSADLYGTTVSAAGAVEEPGGDPLVAAAGAQYAPTAVFAGSGYLAAWEDGGCGDPMCSDILVARLGADGSVVSGSVAIVSTAADAEFTPAAAYDGANFLEVWADPSAGGSDIYGTLLGPDGSPQGASRIPISTAAGAQDSPEVAWDGTSYLVVWVDGRSGASDIYGARVSPQGEVLDPGGIPISTAIQDQFGPKVAWGGSSYLVVWLDARSGLAVFASRVSESGEVMDASGIRISRASDGQGPPALACDGATCLVIWVDYSAATSHDVFGARVSDAGEILDVPPITVSSAANGQSAPEVAWNGEEYVAVWEDFRLGSSFDVFGARISASGATLDPSGIAISTEPGAQFAARIAWNGVNWVVVWADSRSGRDDDLYSARLGASGALVPAGSTGLAIAASSREEGFPKVVAGPAGRAAIVYNRFSPSPEHGSQRAFMRFSDECLQDGAHAGVTCPFSLVSPPDGALLQGPGGKPTFWWAAGSQSAFRVEFSANLDLSKPRVRSRKKLRPGTSWVATFEKWRAISGLAPRGQPIYWRVIGKTSGSKVKTAAPEVFSFTIAP